jgi:DNA primase
VADLELPVGRRRVRVTHPDRVLFPGDGVTKGDLAEYYAAIGDAIVPHLRERPFTLKRYPYGIRGQPYFAKQAPKGKPPWIPTRRFRTWPREGESRLVDFTLVNEPAALVWMVQMNCIDMNAWYSRAGPTSCSSTSTHRTRGTASSTRFGSLTSFARRWRSSSFTRT